MPRFAARGFSHAFRLKDFAVIADWFAFYFFLVGGAAIVLAGLAAWATQDIYTGIRVFALSGIFSGACSICGWVLGLLFGIPRTLARPQPNTPANTVTGNSAPQQVTNRVNTNLEDVSDWLTKTLIGVGLTQLYLVPSYLWSASGKINDYGFAWSKSGQLLALALFLYSAFGGFWLGYIATRTILTKLLDSLEGPDSRTVEIALAPEQLRLELTGKDIVPSRNLEVAEADTALLQTPVYSLSSARQLAAWGAAKARSGDLGAAAFALEQASLADPSEVSFKEALAKIYRVSGRTNDADRILRSAPYSETTMLGALYADTKEGFEKAIEIGRVLSSDKATSNSLNLRVWLACAFGQQHKWAISVGDKEKAEASRKAVVEEVKLAIAIDPVAKPWLRSLWRPEAGSPDNDLASISSDDPDLSSLLLDIK